MRTNLTVAEAQDLILASVSPLYRESLAASDARGRVLAVTPQRVSLESIFLDAVREERS